MSEHQHHPYADLCSCGHETVSDRMVRLAALPPNWDSYGAPAIDGRAIAAAITFTDSFAVRPEAVIPRNDGGLQLDWRFNDLYVEFEPDGSIEAAVSFLEGDSYKPVTLLRPAMPAAQRFLCEQLQVPA